MGKGEEDELYRAYRPYECPFGDPYETGTVSTEKTSTKQELSE